MSSGTTIFPGNDHLIRIVGLRDDTDLTYLNASTVAANLLDDFGGTLISGGGPITLSNVAAGNVGGTGVDTVVAATVKARAALLTVTVGATNALALSAGDWVRFHDFEGVYRVSADAAGIAAATVTILLETELAAKLLAGTPIFAVGGVYRGTLQDTASIVAGTKYVLEITSTAPDAKTHIEVTAANRTD